MILPYCSRLCSNCEEEYRVAYPHEYVLKWPVTTMRYYDAEGAGGEARESEIEHAVHDVVKAVRRLNDLARETFDGIDWTKEYEEGGMRMLFPLDPTCISDVPMLEDEAESGSDTTEPCEPEG